MSELRLFARLAVLTGLALLLAVPGYAQFNSAIEGSVSDSSGAVIPDVEVTLSNVDTGVSYKARTSSAGYYRFPALQAGNYKITASKEGFQTVVQENIVLEAVRVQSVPLTMSVGAVRTEVTVRAAPPAVET